MKRTTLAERAASIIFEGIEAKGDEFVLRASSLERLGALVLEAAKTDDFGAVAREVSTVMGFLSSKEGTRPICDALSALGSEMRVALGPQIERMMLDLGESHAERGAGAARWLGASVAAAAPHLGQTKAAIVSDDPQLADELRGALERARSGPTSAKARMMPTKRL